MKLNSKHLIIAIYCCIQFLVSTQGSSSNDVCHSLATCGECIREPNCAWCNKVNNSHHHCQLQTQNGLNSCPSNDSVIPTENYTTIADKPLSTSSGKAETIILCPQSASLTNLRRGKPFNFTLKYKAVKNYPADLYYLMDVSLSMRDDKASLVQLAEILVDTMKNISSDFKIGFGSFVDKNVLPYVESLDSSENCGEEFDCVTYSFRNKLSLSKNVQDFTSAVSSTKIIRTTVTDVPEGGFDALLQAIVCKDQIGWRDSSRRLIVFATDAYSHLAGNGKLGGILKANDGKCHLERSNGTYLEAENQDYPSLGQISRIAKENNINIIFAVTNNPTMPALPSYLEFQKVISGSMVGILAEDSQNIVDIIISKYNKIVSSVEMTDTAGPGVNIRYYSACTGTVIQERNKCENLKFDDVVEFTISVEATDCAASKQIIEFKPVGMIETMKLEMEIICDCPCEKPGNPGFIANATECNSGGNLQCGICYCDSLHSGKNCECSSDHLTLDESQCKADTTTSELCSNRGDCVCGNCECHTRTDPTEVVSGKYCECDNFSCARANGYLCSNNGECKCGQCQCNSGWSGVDCNCATSKDTCIPSGGQDACSGNGICECGSCICKVNAHGTFCQDCPTCPSKCDEFTPCVQCKVFKSGPNMNGTCDDVCTYSITIEDTLEVWPSERYCSYVNETNCIVSFVYSYDDTTGAKQVRVKREADCPPPPNVLAMGLGLLGAIVGLGIIALLSYRLYTYLHDKREYARFEKESKTAKWNQENNPLYNDPTMTFRNPTYNT